MKKTILAMALVAAGAISSFAQGTIAVQNINTTWVTYTNLGAYTAATNGSYNTTGGRAATTANGYYYALLVQPDTSTITAINPLDPNYSLGMMATNYGVAGGIRGNGGSTGAAVNDWAAPTGSTYNTAGEDYFLLVGWSANEGSTWTQVESELTSGQWLATGSFGVSALGFGYSGAGPNSLVAPEIFGASTGMPGGLTTGITLYAVSAPEPASMALIGLGGASLLLFRRKK